MKIPLAVAALALVMGAGVASADTEGYVWMDYQSYNGATGTITMNTGLMDGMQTTVGFGEFKFKVTGFQNVSSPVPVTDEEINIYAQVNFGQDNQTLLSGYCVDSGAYVDQGNNKYEIIHLEDIFTRNGVAEPVATARANDLRRLFGGYLADVDTQVERAGFAAAIWEVLNEDGTSYSLSTGDFRMADPGGSNDWYDTAGTYLANLAVQPLATGVLALWDNTAQDFAIVVEGSEASPVPEPFTMATALLAIGSLGMYIRKHTRKGEKLAV